MTVYLPPRELNISSESPLWRISVQRYHEMVDAGVITSDDRVELLDGLMVSKPVVKPPHAYATDCASDILRDQLPTHYFIGTQRPLTLSASEPHPDLMVLRGNRRDYAVRHPYAGDVALVVEISDSTLLTDRLTKQRIYAADEIPVYWIVNLPDRQIEVHSQPQSSGSEPMYARREVYVASDSVPLMIDGETVTRIAVSDLLPPLAD